MVDGDRVGHRHDPAAARPKPPAELERGKVEVGERGERSGGDVGAPVDQEARGRRTGDHQGRCADCGGRPGLSRPEAGRLR